MIPNVCENSLKLEKTVVILSPSWAALALRMDR